MMCAGEHGRLPVGQPAAIVSTTIFFNIFQFDSNRFEQKDSLPFYKNLK
jgi:hypothetical protein